MAGSKSDFSENLVLNYVLGRTATWVKPTNYYVALFSAVTESARTEIAEIPRQAIASATSAWTVTPGQLANAAAITFGQPGIQRTVAGFGLYDASSGGNLIYWADTNVVTLVASDNAKFNAGGLVLVEDGAGGGKSDWLEARCLEIFLTSNTFTPPATVYLALFSSSPTEAGGGTELTAAAAPGYARVAVPNDATNWPAVAGNVKTNGIAIDFPPVVGAVTWPSVVGWAMFDAATAGNRLWYGAVSPVLTVSGGQGFRFTPGSIVITED